MLARKNTEPIRDLRWNHCQLLSLLTNKINENLYLESVQLRRFAEHSWKPFAIQLRFLRDSDRDPRKAVESFPRVTKPLIKPCNQRHGEDRRPFIGAIAERGGWYAEKRKQKQPLLRQEGSKNESCPANGFRPGLSRPTFDPIWCPRDLLCRHFNNLRPLPSFRHFRTCEFSNTKPPLNVKFHRWMNFPSETAIWLCFLEQRGAYVSWKWNKNRVACWSFTSLLSTRISNRSLFERDKSGWFETLWVEERRRFAYDDGSLRLTVVTLVLTSLH